MKGFVRRNWKRAAVFVLILGLLAPVAGQVTLVPASAVTQSEINDLKDEAAALEQEKKELEQQLEAVAADKSEALSQKSILEEQIGVIQSEIDNLSSQIGKYEELIVQKTEELAQAEAKEAEQYDLFCQRVRVMEEEGEVSYWSILFGSKDFSDLLDNFMMVEEIIDYDNAVMNELIAIRQQIEQDKADLETAKAELESAKATQEAKRAELKTQESKVDALIDEISGQEDLLEAAHKKLESAAAAMDAEIARKEKELEAQLSASGNPIVSESGFQWPLSGYNTLSSLFGNRIHPITGKPNNHTGIDIPAPKGTNIRAAKSGVVLTSARHSSYGEYVVISHGNGETTLYAHMSKRLVSEGDRVSQGDVIGLVGTTGSSTGNHLHFEIRENGTRVDPVNYFKDMTLYVTSGGKKVLMEH